MGTNVRWWRWRRNPLRRRSDAVEAWVVLVTAVVMAVGMPLAGALGSVRVGSVLLQTREERHRTSAVLTEDAGDPGPGTYARTWAVVRWTASDDTVRTAGVRVAAGSGAGTRTVIWTDRQDRLVSAPLTAGQAVALSAFAGTLAAGGVALLLLAGRKAVRTVLDRHRARQWERAWVLTGPRWSGSRPDNAPGPGPEGPTIPPP
ncbi:Rv1733c family protein [Streptomyces sp. QTS52]